MDTLHRNVTNFFEELLKDIKCQPDTRAYVIGIYGKYKSAIDDLSKDSVTLLFAQARQTQSFLLYQNLADWIFWAGTIVSEHLKFASQDYYTVLAQNAYYTCYRMTNRQWKCYEELADQFPILENQVKEKLGTLIF
jgi:hypothetical protein